jgi:mannose-6-phosphate isomerase-like protein (cupin superfamily)
MNRLFLLTSTALLSATAGSFQAKPAHLKWAAAPSALPSGAQMAVVKGDPGKKGPFVVELKMPVDYAVPAHWHPTDETVKVLSGRIGYGMSDKLDEAKAKHLTPGHSITMKAKMHHWVFARGAATVEVSGMGPFQITYVDPKDDPRH